MHRLLPNPGPTSVEGQLDELELASKAGDPRPYVITNFAITLDGRATLQGRSGAIGSDADTEMLVGLRTKVDAVMIGAGTLRVERYGRILPDPEKRARREREGLPHDPLAVVVSGRLDVPWDAPLFSEGAGEVLIFTTSQAEAPETRTPVHVVRHRGEVDLAAALAQLRTERGVRTLLCEGGPTLHAQLIEAGLVDELFVTHAPKLAGGEGPSLVTGLPEIERPLELAWLLEQDGELFARYRTSRPSE
ncbi:MAG: dihydrofolate reductase family protein [Actinomycetota bacterium]